MDFIITICLGPSLTYGLIIYSHFIGSVQNLEACNFEGPWHLRSKHMEKILLFFPFNLKTLESPYLAKSIYLSNFYFLKIFFHESYLEWSLLRWYQFKPKLSSRKSQINNCVGKTRAIKSTTTLGFKAHKFELGTQSCSTLIAFIFFLLNFFFSF